MAKESFGEALRASSTTKCNKLARAIISRTEDQQPVTIEAIGPVPTSCVMKAVAVANRTLRPKGVLLLVLPRLVTRALDRATSPGDDWVVTELDVYPFTGPRE